MQLLEFPRPYIVKLLDHFYPLPIFHQLMDKFKNDDAYFAHMNREVTSFMILGCRKPLNGRRPTPEEMLLALLVSGRF